MALEAAWQWYPSLEKEEIHRNLSHSTYSFSGEWDMTGKMILRMRKGQLLRVRVVDQTAIGKVIDGSITKEAKFHLEREGKTWRLSIFGEVKAYNRKVLYEEVCLAEDGTWSGWSMLRDQKFTGTWKSNGEFTGEIEAPPMKWKGRFGSEGLEGQGEFTDGNSTYIGNFERGKPHGKGKLIKGCESTEGEWQEGQLITVTSSNGGPFMQNYYRSKCELKGSDWSYKGYLLDGFFEGEGELITQKITLAGTFRAGKPHGFCTYTTIAKDVTYAGLYKEGKRHGKGKLECPKFTYEGTFKNGFMHGQGNMTTQKGSYTVLYKRGNLVAMKPQSSKTVLNNQLLSV